MEGQEAKIREAALLLLARREHSQQELLKKLERKAFPADLIILELKKLAVERLQSDQRFTEAYVHDWMQAGYGPRQIEQALLQRGVESNQIQQALEFGDECWEDLIRSVWTKKFGTKKKNSAETTQDYGRHYRFLSYRGFQPQSIQRFLRGVFNNKVNDEY